MKTKKTFFKIFGVAIAVALLGASCTNVEPTPKPTKPTEPGIGFSLCDDLSAPIISLSENFDDVADNSDISLTGWQVFKVKGDRNWQGKIFTSGTNTEKYAQASAHKGGEANYESWLVSPPLNLDDADSKSLSFKTAKAFWKETSSLKVYVLQCNGSTTTKTELTSANIVKETDTDHIFVSSGIVDLSSFTGKVYIGFQYIALGGASNSTTFRIDDVYFNNTSSTETQVSFVSQAPTSAYIDTEFAYNIQTQVINALGDTEISATGLPAWASFAANTNGTASITGTPDEAGSHSITITATNNSIVATQVFTLVVTPAPVVGDNLLTNPSFELWEESKPTGWTLLSTTVTGVVNSAESTIVQNGDKSFKLDASGASGTVNWAQTVAITGGQKYRLSMSYYILSGDGTDARIWSNFKKGETFFLEADLIATNLYSVLRGPGNTNSFGSAYFPDEKGAWKTYTITFTAPTDATAFDFQFRTYRNAVVYWDNFSLVNVIE